MPIFFKKISGRTVDRHIIHLEARKKYNSLNNTVSQSSRRFQFYTGTDELFQNNDGSQVIEEIAMTAFSPGSVSNASNTMKPRCSNCNKNHYFSNSIPRYSVNRETDKIVIQAEKYLSSSESEQSPQLQSPNNPCAEHLFEEMNMYIQELKDSLQQDMENKIKDLEEKLSNELLSQNHVTQADSGEEDEISRLLEEKYQQSLTDNIQSLQKWVEERLSNQLQLQQQLDYVWEYVTRQEALVKEREQKKYIKLL